MSPKNDNQSKITTFFQEEYEALQGFVRSKIDQTADSDAEDILQDVALRIFSRPENALPINNISGFVYRTLKNRIIDIMRTKKQRVDDENELNRSWANFAELFYGENEVFYSDNVIRNLKASISELKPTYRDIIIAVDFEGYSYREISQETGISKGTLMSRRHRAMGILLKKLKTNKNI